ncbi:hypothetical protein NW762_004608 [Fusarium torreyae]|uniref:Uncharacterized protein n=1 Tax=Fusarium torreyae TaxID=1237075 RepID=A0A9W8VFV8_9HYPO|nr:hypothetical protein NW762_004608 [Fusarium torreyae]
MPGNDSGVAPQADIVGIPGAALNTLSFAQGLLRALSADSVNPHAVIQVQAMGSCFQSNGPWVAELPDIMSRTSCVRLERISTWMGWEKGDTPSFMSQTPGGKTAALICCALGNLYPEDRCGFLLYELCRRILPQEQQVSSPAQLGDVCMVLQSKVECLGFGNHLAFHVTRLRQSFFEAELGTPQDFADIPTEEDMSIFLEKARDALRDESLVLQISGTRCVGTLLASMSALCPEDITVIVNREVLMRGCRENIVFSISDTPGSTTQLHLEKKLKVHESDFRKSYTITDSQHELNDQMSFSYDGILSSQLDLALALVGAAPNQALKLAVANLIASLATSPTETDFWTYGPHPDEYFPAQGLRTVIGPMYQQLIPNRLEKVLCRPSRELQSPKNEFEALQNILEAALPLTHCSCNICDQGNPWNPKNHPKNRVNASEKWKLCPVSQLWRAVSDLAQSSLLFLFVQSVANTSLKSQNEKYGYPALTCYLWDYFEQDMGRESITSRWLHDSILNMLGSWWTPWDPPGVCSSSNASTVYPSTLEFPAMTNPWSVHYNLVDGRLHYHGDCYDGIISAKEDKKSVKALSRKKAKTSIIKGTVTAPSGLGEHTSLLMTLRPAWMEFRRALLLRCQIKQVNSIIDVNFLDLHLGLVRLSPAKGCGHSLSAPLELTESVKATSVMAPVASGIGAIGVTLTHRNDESQFLCCTSGVRQLYQGDCCMLCAVAQAERECYQVVIGGSPSTHHIVDDEDGQAPRR